MTNLSTQRASRELFLAAFGVRLGNVDAWVIDRLTSLLEDVHVEAGSVLFEAGDPPEFVYFMRHGEVRITRAGAPHWTYQGRWLLGSFEALLDSPYARTTTAVVDFDAMRVRRSAWYDLLEDSVQVSRAAVVRTCAAVSALEDRIPVRLLTAEPPEPKARMASPGPLDVMDRLAFLADVRMLRGPGVQVLTDLAEVSREARFATGELLLARGRERTDLVLVVEGAVSANRENPHVERRYGPGDLVCGAAALGEPALAWQAIAGSDVRTVSFPIEAWFELMEEHFDLVRSTLAALSRRRDILLDILGAEGGVTLT